MIMWQLMCFHNYLIQSTNPKLIKLNIYYILSEQYIEPLTTWPANSNTLIDMLHN